MNKIRSIAQGELACGRTKRHPKEVGKNRGALAPEFRSRVGDVALVPFEPVGYLDPDEAGDFQLACRHGSLTAEEMWVPLLGGRGRLDG